MDNWVTDPGALDTLIALQGALPGDEVVFTHDQTRAHTLIREGDVLTVIRDEQGEVGCIAWWLPAGERKPVALLARGASTGVTRRVLLTRDNIKAWRRPDAKAQT